MTYKFPHVDAFSLPEQFAPNLADDSSLVFGLAFTTAIKSFYKIRDQLTDCVRNGGALITFKTLVINSLMYYFRN